MVKSNLPLILIIDDSDYNRELLSEILKDEYKIIQAKNGSEGLKILEKQKQEIACVLLDISMSEMNGFEVMEEMNKNKWLQFLPVIIISSENSNDFIRRGYSLGASDYIFRPYDEVVVRRRLANTVNIYSHQKKLIQIVINNVKETERLSDMMVSILGHTVEFRNKESNAHIKNVSLLTKIFLEELNASTEKYNFSKDQISLISRAAAIHDIGKVSIPDEVINKPGKLTDKEFDLMKTHTTVGAKMLDSIKEYKNEPLVKISYKICRWHHERYDGNGYPDGLFADQIPIEAQVVSLADVYDALTSDRCYKKAFSHDKAIKMILHNECGVFNPDLMLVLIKIQDTLEKKLLTEKKSSKDKEYSFNIEDF